MRLNKLAQFVLVLLISVSVFTCPLISFSHETTDLTNPGLTPDSFWYFGEIIKEHLFVIFTFHKTAKIEKYLEFGEERIAEIQLMKEKEKYRESTVAADEFISLMGRAKGTINTMSPEQIEQITNKVNQESSFQIFYLKKIIKSTTDQILKPKLQQAKIESVRLRDLVRD